MLVRLINPFVAILSRLDTAATASKVGGRPGYDSTFREPQVQIVDGRRVSARAEMTELRINVQVEDRTWEALKAYDNGTSPEVGLGLVAHFHELRQQGLVDCETGKPMINVNDRLDRIEDIRGNVVTVVRTPPGLYCIEARPMSYGIGRTLNLLMLVFKERSHGANV